MASQDLSPKLRVPYGVLKVAAIAAGFVGSFVSIMAAVGAATESSYARVGAALAGVIVLPLGVADRLLPKDDPKRARGLVTDVFAVGLLGFALLFTAAGNTITRPLLLREGDRLVRAGWDGLARVAYLLARADVAWPPPQNEPAPPPSAGGSAGVNPASSSVPVANPSDAGAPDASAASDAAPPGPPDAGAKTEKTPADLFQELSPSVVTIFSGSKGQRSGSGTGFVIDREGTITTNHHVIKGAGQVRIKFKNGAFYDTVDLLVEAAETDLALLRIDLSKPSNDSGASPEVTPLPLGDSEKVVVGERALSIGNPLGLEHTLTDGLVSSRRIYEGRAWIQMSVPISPGNSGGPLFNMRGEVIGITTAQVGGPFASAQNLNLAIPVNELKRLIQPSYPQRRRLGEDGVAPSQW
jgi:S1-C subfamily serine protease